MYLGYNFTSTVCVRSRTTYLVGVSTSQAVRLITTVCVRQGLLIYVVGLADSLDIRVRGRPYSYDRGTVCMCLGLILNTVLK